jgi:hypothetical protein
MMALAFAGCSGSQSGNNELSLKIDNGKAEAWINVMPGSMQTFFVTGSINIENYGDSTVNSIKIMKCLVYQNKLIKYNIIPDLKDSLGSELSVGPRQLKKGLFTSKGVELKNEFNTDKPVDLMIYFESSKMIKQVLIPGVIITKAH